MTRSKEEGEKLLNDLEQLAERATAFGRACERLATEVIAPLLERARVRVRHASCAHDRALEVHAAHIPAGDDGFGHGALPLGGRCV